MSRASTVTLIGDVPQAHGVHELPAVTRREVFCPVKSASRAEGYEAMSQGLRPEKVLILSDEAEYQGEKRCIFEGVAWRIIRTYTRRDWGVELVIERAETDDI